MSAYVSWAKGHRNKEGGDRIKTQIEKRGEEAKVRRRLRGRASGASRNKGQHAHAHAHTHTHTFFPISDTSRLRRRGMPICQYEGWSSQRLKMFSHPTIRSTRRTPFVGQRESARSGLQLLPPSTSGTERKTYHLGQPVCLVWFFPYKKFCFESVLKAVEEPRTVQLLRND